MREFKAKDGTVFNWKPEMQGDSLYITPRSLTAMIRPRSAAVFSIPLNAVLQFVTHYQTPPVVERPKQDRFSRPVMQQLTAEQAVMLSVGSRTACTLAAQDARDILSDLKRMGYELHTTAEMDAVLGRTPIEKP